jgi:hypothetical protein
MRDTSLFGCGLTKRRRNYDASELNDAEVNFLKVQAADNLTRDPSV